MKFVDVVHKIQIPFGTSFGNERVIVGKKLDARIGRLDHRKHIVECRGGHLLRLKNRAGRDFAFVLAGLTFFRRC